MKKDSFISGAYALAFILRKEKVRYVYAYPGTSELAICNEILKVRGIRLINGRGDKESAFMAAGGSLLRASHAVAVLHGARGLTNAVGALADARRNEIGTVYFVGLPSTTSAQFLPPHGEPNLISGVGNFAKYHDEITEQNPVTYIEKVRNAIAQSRCLPYGPVILGIPQDMAEKEWIPRSMLTKYKRIEKKRRFFISKINEAISYIDKANKIVIFLDDFIYKQVGIKKAIAKFAEKVNAPIFQVFYARGPMLFERTSVKENPYFLGCYRPDNLVHKSIMADTDLLITLEDRNMYSRVVGELPKVKKIAITSHRLMTLKNKYLMKGDLVLEGNVLNYLRYIQNKMKEKGKKKNFESFCRNIRATVSEDIKLKWNYSLMRKAIIRELSNILKKVKQPVLIDDSQMFGGMIALHYEELPANLRVFGDHGAFIGGGLSYATGLAQCEEKTHVFNTLGDQSFTNGLQGLVASVQEKTPIIYLVCNNGKSVSLFKQALYQDNKAFDKGKNIFLYNAPYEYTKLAESLGIIAYKISFLESNQTAIKKSSEKFRFALHQALVKKRPVLIELVLPSDFEAWKGIWAIKGNEK
ncbi:MAG: thiamine pyrophosphate-binding protein [Patescibacteria group bacterium]